MYCKRRRFITLMTTAGAGYVVARVSSEAALAKVQEPILISPVRDQLFRVTVGGINALVMSTSDGLLLVDSAATENIGVLMGALQERFGDVPVAVGYNTHWHWDHTGGNEVLRGQGAHLIAHENTRLWLGGDFWVEAEQRRYRPRPALAIPDEGFYETHVLQFAACEVRAGLLFQAHTDGDIYVQFPEQNVIAAGDVVAHKAFPEICYATGGWIGGLVDAQTRLLELADEDTIIIPGRGMPIGVHELAEQHAMLTEIRDRMFELVKKGLSADDMLDAGVAKGFEKWGDPRRLIHSSYPGLWQNPHYFTRGIF